MVPPRRKVSPRGFLCLAAAEAADVMVIDDDDSSGSDGSMVSVYDSLSSVVSVDTNSSIFLDSDDFSWL